MLPDISRTARWFTSAGWLFGVACSVTGDNGMSRQPLVSAGGPSGQSAGAAGDGVADPSGPTGPGSFDNAAQSTTASPSVMQDLSKVPVEGGECGASTVEAEQVIVEEVIEIEEEVSKPLDIYMIVDDSGSMVPWWPGTLDALNMFFRDPGSAGIGVGVQFFGSSCDAAAYATPRVAIAELPGHIPDLEVAFPLIPVEGTATVPAMKGAIQHARSWVGSHPDRTVVVLLVTDGLPDECASTVQGVVDVVSEGYSGTPSIPTFVVGLGFDLAALNQFAAAGGSVQATLVAPGAAVELLGALQGVRDTVIETRVATVERVVETPLECEWVIPDSPAGGTFDRDKVNVQLTSGSGAQTPTLGKVASGGDCAANGWHFDQPQAPTRIIACPQTCDTIQGTSQARVDILLGCKTVPLK